MSAKRLGSRGVVAVSGTDAPAFLHGLVTADIEQLNPDGTAFGALLTPQGKILFDFIIHLQDGAYLFDLPGHAVMSFMKRLGLYKLRSRVNIADVSEQYTVVFDPGPGKNNMDPRLESLGQRYVVLTADAPAEDGDIAHHALSVSHGIAECWIDFGTGNVFPHEANFDRLHGIDFAKGCYVGQEVVSRMHHRGTSRKRFLPCRTKGPAPVVGAEITTDGRVIGHAGSASNGNCLALLRLDRIDQTISGAAPLISGETKIWPEIPPWAQEAEKREERAAE